MKEDLLKSQLKLNLKKIILELTILQQLRKRFDLDTTIPILSFTTYGSIDRSKKEAQDILSNLEQNLEKPIDNDRIIKNIAELELKIKTINFDTFYSQLVKNLGQEELYVKGLTRFTEKMAEYLKSAKIKKLIFANENRFVEMENIITINTELEEISFKQTYLNKLPETFNFPLLKKLDLSNNQLEEIPSKFCKSLVGLEYFNIDNNNISSLPDYEFSFMKEVTLHNNQNNFTEEAIKKAFPNLKYIPKQNNNDSINEEIKTLDNSTFTKSFIKNPLKKEPTKLLLLMRSNSKLNKINLSNYKKAEKEENNNDIIPHPNKKSSICNIM